MNPPTDRVRHTVPPTPTADGRVRLVWAAVRLALGWIFLWAFLDKTFGLGHETARDAAWVNGGSPTEGFLAHAAEGPFQGFYQGLAGHAVIDWLFMLGLLGVGAALLLGVALRPAAAAGAVMLVMMWTAVLPPANNPFMDDHIVYALVLVGLALTNAGDTLGLGRAWARLPLVRQRPFLR
ncbi:DoxX family membrane protein [Actinocorallia sp. A-T 12471]|uniref:DoxX family membrane protein n=1 Tax=Actinocorallia sp. A-T 12471 TaxID=3089813 RepID=UPI0029CC47F6|nr:DoxX family membrane protein [Actinocorallia sp. A-T 12471]MDX6743886.1 DoxX family membrane protein [Actinocorallia sp. A-T 12471]